MKANRMRIALLAGLVLATVSNLSVPILSAPPTPGDAVATAGASLAPRVAVPPFKHLLATFRGVRSAGPSGYAIPADHPRPPLGRFKLTAYSGPQLGQAKPITKTGTSALAGRTVAVDPRIIPLGSRIYIEGIGERIAEDVGGGVKGHHIDVYLRTVPAAREFGVQRGTVSVIAVPPDAKS